MVCVVGESGCGKTVTALSVLDSSRAARTIAGGKILFQGRDLWRSDATMQVRAGKSPWCSRSR